MPRYNNKRWAHAADRRCRSRSLAACINLCVRPAPHRRCCADPFSAASRRCHARHTWGRWLGEFADRWIWLPMTTGDSRSARVPAAAALRAFIDARPRGRLIGSERPDATPCAQAMREGPGHGAPYGNRTRVSAVKGRRPGPLDEGREAAATYRELCWYRQARAGARSASALRAGDHRRDRASRLTSARCWASTATAPAGAAHRPSARARWNACRESGRRPSDRRAAAG